MLQNEQKSSSVKFSDRLGIVKKNKGFDISVAERKRGGIVTIRYRDDTELDSIISFFE